jgi:hypothetical protein
VDRVVRPAQVDRADRVGPQVVVDRLELVELLVAAGPVGRLGHQARRARQGLLEQVVIDIARPREIVLR